MKLIGTLIGLLLIAACTQPIGGETDTHGCLVSAGESWCEKTASCIRAWETDCPSSPPEMRTRALTNEYLTGAEDITYLAEEAMRCPGCYQVEAIFTSDGERQAAIVTILNWEVTDVTPIERFTPDGCSAAGGTPRNAVESGCSEGERSIGVVEGFVSPNYCCVGGGELAYREAAIRDCDGIVGEEYFYNEATNTYWFDFTTDEPQEGCNPACVVDAESMTAEINWRCTGGFPGTPETQCVESGGTWAEFPNSCADSCALERYPSRISCLQAITKGCDCGPDACWTGSRCEPNEAEVTSFEECVDAGFPVMESYPRQCSDGVIVFTEEFAIEPEVEACQESGGTWMEFSNGCQDSCDYRRNPETILCSQAFTMGCNCGAGMCWNGAACEQI